MSSSDTPDDILLAAHVAGDAEAFGTLFSRHRDRLWAVALRTTGNPDDAADALQDAMISAFRRAETFRGQSSVTTWLHRIVVNACLDRLRHLKSRQAAPLPDDLERHLQSSTLSDSTLSGSTPRSLDPAEAAVRGDQRDAVLAALATLPPEHRAALVLVDMEGYPIAEVAQMLGCATGTVKSRCSRGRAKLRDLLRDQVPDDVSSPTPGNRARAGPVPSRTESEISTATETRKEEPDD